MYSTLLLHKVFLSKLLMQSNHFLDGSISRIWWGLEHFLAIGREAKGLQGHATGSEQRGYGYRDGYQESDEGGICMYIYTLHLLHMYVCVEFLELI